MCIYNIYIYIMNIHLFFESIFSQQAVVAKYTAAELSEFRGYIHTDFMVCLLLICTVCVFVNMYDYIIIYHIGDSLNYILLAVGRQRQQVLKTRRNGHGKSRASPSTHLLGTLWQCNMTMKTTHSYGKFRKSKVVPSTIRINYPP